MDVEWRALPRHEGLESWIQAWGRRADYSVGEGLRPYRHASSDHINLETIEVVTTTDSSSKSLSSKRSQDIHMQKGLG